MINNREEEINDKLILMNIFDDISLLFKRKKINEMDSFIDNFYYRDNLSISNSINRYIFEVLPKKNDYTYDDLNIFIRGIFNYLMTFFDRPFSSSLFMPLKHCVFQTIYAEGDFQLVISEKLLKQRNKGNLNRNQFAYRAIKITRNLIHEFAHTRQIRHIERIDDVMKDDFFKEHVVSYYDFNFYIANHDLFLIEQTADALANEFTKYVLNGLFTDEEIDNNLSIFKIRLDYAMKERKEIFQEIFTNKYNFLAKNKENIQKVKNIFKN